MKTISVVIPAFNSERYIAEALESVLRQTTQPHEIIVVDDGSTDGTREVVQKFKNRVKYIYQDNAGSGKARNTGIINAKGELIAFLDSDDVWADNHLKGLVNKLVKHPEAAMAYGARKWIDKEGNPVKDESGQTRYPSGWIFNELFTANYIGSTSAVIVRKDALLIVGGFNESPVFRNAQDYDLWLRIAARFPIVSEPSVVFYYRRHDSNRTLDNERRVRGLLAALNNAADMIKSGTVDPKNHPEKIDVKDRMRRAYREAVVSLFFAKKYDQVRKIGAESLRKGYMTQDLLIRLSISFLPNYIIDKLRLVKRACFCTL